MIHELTKPRDHRNAAASNGIARSPAKAAKPDPDVQKSPSVCGAPAAAKAPAKKKCTPARDAIVATTFRQETNSAVRRHWNSRTSARALTVLTSGPRWVDAIRAIFVARFGDHWQALATDTMPSRSSGSSATARSQAILPRQPVIGVAVDWEALPSARPTAADLTMPIDAPPWRTIGRAIRQAGFADFIPAKRGISRGLP